MSESKYQGIHAVLVTPLAQSGQVDEPAVRHLVDFCCEQQFAGVVVLASNGEYPYLSLAEKRAVMQTAAEQAQGRITVIAGVSAPGTEQAGELAKEAKEAGCDAALAELSHYYWLDNENILHHFRTLADRSELPIVFYYIPDTTRLVLTPEQIAEVGEIDGIEAVVLAMISVPFLKEVIRLTSDKNLPVLAGTSFIFKESLEAGAAGLCCPLPVLGADDIKAILTAHRQGDTDKCEQAQERVLGAVSLYSGVVSENIDPAAIFRGLSSRPAPASPRWARPVHIALKEALRLQGHPLTNMVKPPYRPIGKEQSLLVNVVMNQLGWLKE